MHMYAYVYIYINIHTQAHMMGDNFSQDSSIVN